MLELEKMDGTTIIVNADEIETIEPIHDTVICLRSGKKIVVKDTYQMVIDKTIEYKRMCFSKYINQDN